MARDDETRVRIFALATFPFMLVLLWQSVDTSRHPVIVVGAIVILLMNAVSWILPWERVPRWTETIPCDVSIVALVLMAACAGGSNSVFGLVVVVPLLWLATFADGLELVVGFLIACAGVLLPLDSIFHQLPPQGSLHEDLGLLVLAGTAVAGVRPVVLQLRRQVRDTDMAVHALRAAQSALAHDLRNPLAATYAVATLAAQRVQPEGPAPDQKLAEHLELLLTSTRRMEATIAGVLELSRAGERLEVIEPVNLAALVDEVAASIPGLHVEHSDLPNHVLGDPDSLRRLLRSLFGVAVHRAADPRADESLRNEARVVLHGTELADVWRITVRHDGLPMDARALAARLEPMRRADDPDRDGDALQLSIVAAIVEQHGGTIEVDLDAVSPTISFTLARHPQHAAAPIG
jgi:signal transduction histidine kinase